ncbi:MAG: flagellar motor switch protein FliM [Planctomycetota bacterium]
MEVLDQSEVDALLAAVDSGEVEEEQSAARIFTRQRRDLSNLEIRDYDFKRPERVSKDQMRALQTLHEAFARNFGASLSGFLRTIVEVKVATCEQMTYAEFVSGLPNPTSFNLIESPGLQGQICLELSPLIIYPVIDRLLGGSTTELFIPQRPMTLIETRLISNVTNRGLEALTEAWESVRALPFEITSTESNPQLVQIVPPNEVVVVIGFELKMSNRAGTMNLCIPYAVIEPFVSDLDAQSWFSASRQTGESGLKERIGDGLHRADLEVAAELARTTVTLSDLRNLQVGDLLVTEKPAAEPIILRVEGEAKFRGAVGQHRGKRAIRVERPLNQQDRY